MWGGMVSPSVWLWAGLLAIYAPARPAATPYRLCLQPLACLMFGSAGAPHPLGACVGQCGGHGESFGLFMGWIIGNPRTGASGGRALPVMGLAVTDQGLRAVNASSCSVGFEGDQAGLV
jgi:hypothetical protein